MVSETYQVSLNGRELIALEKYIGSSCPKERFWAFNRVELSFSCSVICGLAYKRMRIRNCAAVKYLINNIWAFAMVLFFIKYDLSTRDPLYLALAHPLSCTSLNPNLHTNRVVPYDPNDVVVINVSTVTICCNS